MEVRWQPRHGSFAWLKKRPESIATETSCPAKSLRLRETAQAEFCFFENSGLEQFELLRSGSFLNRHDNLLLFGKPASGKTILLSALGRVVHATVASATSEAACC